MIVVDRREMGEHPDIPGLLSLQIRVETLDSADYAFLTTEGALGIERCEIQNFIQKLRSGELEDQLVRCADQYQTVFVLIEGVFDQVSGYISNYRKDENRGSYWRTRIDPSVRYAEVASALVRLSQLGFEVIQTANFEVSMLAIKAIYEQRTKTEEEHHMFKSSRSPKVPSRLTNNPKVPMLMALCPRLPEKTAIRLINKYETLFNIMFAEEEELLQVEGFGRTLLRRLKDNFGAR